MGRTRSFDEHQVLASAAAAFRHDGYEGTSIDRLVSATGVHRGSLYSAFGSKRGLFLSALRAEATAPALSDELTDLLLVALLEVAARDPEVHLVVDETLTRHRLTAGALGHRLLARAGIPAPDAHPEEEP